MGPLPQAPLEAQSLGPIRQASRCYLLGPLIRPRRWPSGPPDSLRESISGATGQPPGADLGTHRTASGSWPRDPPDSLREPSRPARQLRVYLLGPECEIFRGPSWAVGDEVGFPQQQALMGESRLRKDRNHDSKGCPPCPPFRFFRRPTEAKLSLHSQKPLES